MLALFLALLAGSLSILSPCVLPLVPVVLGTAASHGRQGPLALAAGLVLSFVAIGMFVGVIGFSIGLDGAFFRSISALMLIAVGLFLAVPVFQSRFAGAAGPAASWLEMRYGQMSLAGAWGQFAIGLLLGAIWSPCVGPTLGAASVLAARGESLGQVALTMSFFGAGVALPLVILGLMSRELLGRWRSLLLNAGSGVKTILGIAFVVTGLFIISGLDKQVETFLVQASPAWLTNLTTRF
jgi:cytochrome c-type biogenesis protein